MYSGLSTLKVYFAAWNENALRKIGRIEWYFFFFLHFSAFFCRRFAKLFFSFPGHVSSVIKGSQCYIKNEKKEYSIIHIRINGKFTVIS